MDSELTEGFEGLVHSPLVLEVLQQAKQFANYNRSILIRGERGTGKELLARYIHHQSPRRNEAFTSINCAAFSENLLDSELFGHEKGAFTGASDQKKGRLELSDRGTLFMDEVGNMPPLFQEKLLRVLEYREFERLGGNETLKVDVRFLSATNAPLEEMCQTGAFRSDLFDRLCFAQLTMPPLRNRRDEIPHLLAWCVRQLHLEIPNLESKRFHKLTLDYLVDYHWPGNIREFKNVIERLYLGPTTSPISPDHLPPEIYTRAEGGTFDDKIEDYKRQIITETLINNAYNQRLSAKKLGMTYDSFRHYYRKYGLHRLKPA